MQEVSSNTFTSPHPLKTAVLFLVFNRPDTTRQVFEAIRKAKPPRLYVAADGPRADKPGEAEKVEQARRIAMQVDWECEIKTLFRDENLGCKIGVSSAIDWFFENVEDGIILEDDCLPEQSFFWFCQELLERYRDDKRIMTISGNNFQFGRKRTDYSYYFSRYMHCWGWATWKRAWQYFDLKMTQWPKIRDEGWLNDILDSTSEVISRKKLFDSAFKNEVDSWARVWTYSIWLQNGLNILPNINLVSNIGFDSDSTHTKDRNKHYANMKTEIMKIPLQHPPFIIRDSEADAFTRKTHFGSRYSISKIIERIKYKLFG